MFSGADDPGETEHEHAPHHHQDQDHPQRRPPRAGSPHLLTGALGFGTLPRVDRWLGHLPHLVDLGFDRYLGTLVEDFTIQYVSPQVQLL